MRHWHLWDMSSEIYISTCKDQQQSVEFCGTQNLFVHQTQKPVHQYDSLWMFYKFAGVSIPLDQPFEWFHVIPAFRNYKFAVQSTSEADSRFAKELKAQPCRMQDHCSMQPPSSQNQTEQRKQRKVLLVLPLLETRCFSEPRCWNVCSA